MRVLVVGIPDIADDDYFEAPQQHVARHAKESFP
jgi:hypothetical protein